MNGTYESPRILREYLAFHYGSVTQILPYAFGPTEAVGFPVRCVRELVDTSRSLSDGPPFELAYDLGCAVGRSTFELAAYATTVRGFDLSAAFIGAANHLLKKGQLETELLIEGAITERITLCVPVRDLATTVTFEIGDVIGLAAELPPADIVLAANLLCRLSTPALFLKQMGRLIKPDGQLILVTPLTWLEEFTPKAAWPRDGNGAAVAGATWLAGILNEQFRLELTRDMPFLIREHARKFQWGVSLGMRWRRCA